jgi:hypothetical protein
MFIKACVNLTGIFVKIAKSLRQPPLFFDKIAKIPKKSRWIPPSFSIQSKKVCVNLTGIFAKIAKILRQPHRNFCNDKKVSKKFASDSLFFFRRLAKTPSEFFAKLRGLPLKVGLFFAKIAKFVPKTRREKKAQLPWKLQFSSFFWGPKFEKSQNYTEADANWKKGKKSCDFSSFLSKKLYGDWRKFFLYLQKWRKMLRFSKVSIRTRKVYTTADFCPKKKNRISLSLGCSCCFC